MRHDDSVWSEGSAGSAAASQHSADSAGSRTPSREASSRPRGAVLDRVGADMHCCTFRIGGQLFALDVGAVGEVLHVDRVVRVPLAPPGVLGLTNLRGAAVAIVDLAAVLGLELGPAEPAAAGQATALVFNLQGMRFAAAIDAVESVFPIHSDEIRESAAIGEHSAIAGFLTLADQRVASVLDLGELAERVQRLRLRQTDGGDKQDGGSEDI
jgi:purine-binding chemotaxis protein CheW